MTHTIRGRQRAYSRQCSQPVQPLLPSRLSVAHSSDNIDQNLKFKPEIQSFSKEDKLGCGLSETVCPNKWIKYFLLNGLIPKICNLWGELIFRVDIFSLHLELFNELGLPNQCLVIGTNLSYDLKSGWCECLCLTFLLIWLLEQHWEKGKVW